MASSSAEVGSLAVAGPSREEGVELSVRVRALARENELDKALEAVLVKAQAGCVRLHANVELVQSLVRTTEQGICGNTKPSNSTRKFQPPQRRRRNRHTQEKASVGR
ncbi:uncharacterized protein [Acropora muricata]|uniref:uncharacterized protein n=1 Tax=Acropora muricata TaxID=159855 RepID=UPI0034E56981